MALFGKSFEDQVAEAIRVLPVKVGGLKHVEASIDGKTVTLTGEAETLEAKGAAMATFNQLVKTENTFNKIKVAAPAAPPAAPVAAASPAAPAPAPAAAAAPAAAPAGAGKVHVVEKGDTLSAIAKRYYGKAGLYTKIFDANRDVLDDPNLIKPGQKLRIPD